MVRLLLQAKVGLNLETCRNQILISSSLGELLEMNWKFRNKCIEICLKPAVYLGNLKYFKIALLQWCAIKKSGLLTKPGSTTDPPFKQKRNFSGHILSLLAK